jgi:hypothetical protein
VAGDPVCTAAAIALALTSLISAGGKVILLISGIATFAFAVVQTRGIRMIGA